MDCYGHLFPGQEADAIAQVRKLMSARSEALQATGTDDQTAQADTRSSWNAKQCVPGAKECDEKTQPNTQMVSPKPLEIAGLGDTQQRNATGCESEGGATRTPDLRIKSPYATSKNTDENDNLETSAAPRAAVVTANSSVDSELQSIIEQWKDLSEATKAHVVTSVFSGAADASEQPNPNYSPKPRV